MCFIMHSVLDLAQNQSHHFQSSLKRREHSFDLLEKQAYYVLFLSIIILLRIL